MSYHVSAYGQKNQAAKQPDPPRTKPSTAQSWKQEQQGQEERVPPIAKKPMHL
jgi:hypothetical protein